MSTASGYTQPDDQERSANVTQWTQSTVPAASTVLPSVAGRKSRFLPYKGQHRQGRVAVSSRT